MNYNLNGIKMLSKYNVLIWFFLTIGKQRVITNMFEIQARRNHLAILEYKPSKYSISKLDTSLKWQRDCHKVYRAPINYLSLYNLSDSNVFRQFDQKF